MDAWSCDEFGAAFAEGRAPESSAVLDGMLGRVIRGRDPDHLEMLAFPHTKRLAWVYGPGDLRELPGKRHLDLVFGARGNDPKFVRAKLKDGQKWHYLVFRGLSGFSADWNGLFQAIDEHYAEVASRLRRWAAELQEASAQHILGAAGLQAANEAKGNASDPQHMSPERYLAVEDTLENARLFLLHSVGVNEHYKGDGLTDGGHTEYLVRNVRLAELEEYALIPLTVEL
jgi:hypothetical protein